MFIHSVIFNINPKEVARYRKDSLMWARYARRYKGFLGYYTMKRTNAKNQYVSAYAWKTESDNKRFMSKLHDWLVAKSKARVKPLGYYQWKILDKVV